MKKVLVFGMTDNPGGIESVIMNYYRNIDRRKLHFDFLCNYPKMVYEDEVKNTGGKVIYITPRRKNFWKFKSELKKFMKKHASEYEAIWINLCSLVNIDYLIEAKRYNIPKRIIHCHNADNDAGKIKWFIHQFNKKRIIHYATDFWSCSESASEWFFNKKVIKSDHYKVIPNAIDVKRFEYDPEIRKEQRKKYGVENKIVIGHIGRFHFQKNHKYLISVFKQLVDENDDFHLLLVGQGDLEKEIKQLVNGSGITSKVTFVGAVLDIENIYQAMDIFTLPSVFEGLGVVVLEAEANGLPCVLSDAVPQDVKINNNVFFLPLNEDKAIWCNKLKKLVEVGREKNNKMLGSIFNINNQSKDFENYIIN